MKKRYLKYLSFGVFLGLSYFGVTLNAYSSVGKVYYVTSVKTEYMPADPLYKFHTTAQYNEITGIGDLDRPIGMSGVLTPAVCGMAIEFYYKKKCLSLVESKSNYQVDIVNPYITWRKALEQLRKQIGSSGNIFYKSAVDFNIGTFCAGYGVTQNDQNITTTPKWLPGTYCQNATPPTLKCSSSLSNTIVDFHSIAPKDIPATKKKVIMTTTCNAKATVIVTPVWGAQSIPFNNDATGQYAGLLAKAFIDGSEINGRYTYESIPGKLDKDIIFALERKGEVLPGPASATAVFLLTYN